MTIKQLLTLMDIAQLPATRPTINSIYTGGFFAIPTQTFDKYWSDSRHLQIFKRGQENNPFIRAFNVSSRSRNGDFENFSIPEKVNTSWGKQEFPPKIYPNVEFYSSIIEIDADSLLAQKLNILTEKYDFLSSAEKSAEDYEKYFKSKSNVYKK